MGRRKLNPLAIFASGIAAFAVWSNRLHITEPQWIGASLIGALVAIAWLRNKSIGRWLSVASVVLFVCLVLAEGQTAQTSRIVSSGACAGILLVMLVNLVVKLKARP